MLTYICCQKTDTMLQMVTFEEQHARLNAQQKLAVDTIDGPVLVIAGPGTGKTQLLSLRVANILHKTDASPGNILCLTYTESGKSAMKSRLNDMLGSLGEQVEIHTFHGFGNYLINHFPEYFPKLQSFRPADDLALYEALFSCLSSLPRSNPLSKMAYGQFFYQNDAASRISTLKRAGITPLQATAQINLDFDWAKLNGKNIAKAFEKIGRLSPKSIPQLIKELQPLNNQTPSSELGKLCLEELELAKQTAQADNKTAPLSNFKKKWLVSEEGKLYFKASDQLKKLLTLAELYELYENELQKRQLYDYDDMILYALDKLQTDSSLLSAVQETFQYILADEYQDTNAAQARIITLIADNPVNESRPNVMVVGDDDQAIYAFQGALGDVLLHFRERWRDVQTITLKDNYRSSQSIIDTARRLILTGQNRLENYYEDINKSLTGQTPFLSLEPQVLEAASPQAVLDSAVRAAKSHSVAGEGQLAIIASKHKYLTELAERLDSAKVKYYYEGREDLLSDKSVTKLLLLAEAALAINQSRLEHTSYVLPEIIALGLLPVSRPQAWQVAITAKQQSCSWWEALKLADSAVKSLGLASKDLEPQDALASLQTVAKQFSLRVSGKIGLLVQHAGKYYGREDISLNELLKYTDLCRQAGIRLGQTVIKGNKKAGVLLLSAHRSKGLEFDKVYILHADYKTWFKERGRRNNLVLPEGWKHLELSKETPDDRLRLLYVVMTRAKRELALVRAARQSESLPGLEDLKVVELINEQLEAFEIEPEPAWETWFLPRSAAEQQQLLKLLHPLLAEYHLSPSHLTMFLDVAHGGPAAFLTHILLGIPSPVHPEAIFGSHVHKLLNFAQSQLNKTGKLPNFGELETFIKNLVELSDELTFDISKTVSDFLSQGDVIRPGGEGEYSFANQGLSLGKAQLSGIVDNYLLKNKQLTITDFKTGRAVNSWKVTEDYYRQKLHRFRQQLMFYELLFKLSPDFTDKLSRTSKIAFVEPSRREVYYSLELDAANKERQNLEALIAVVWQHIMQANFPDTAAYGNTFDALQTFEEDLLTGTK